MLEVQDLADLYSELPGTEGVTHGSLQADGIYTPTPLNNAQRRPTTYKQQMMLAGAELIGTFINWDLWAADLATASPPLIMKIGDRITPNAAGSSEVWTIQFIEGTLLQQRKRCLCILNR